jgi:hypothetical protein
MIEMLGSQGLGYSYHPGDETDDYGEVAEPENAYERIGYAIDRFVSGGGPRASAAELLVRSKYFRHSIYQLLPATTCHILPTGRRAKRFP